MGKWIAAGIGLMVLIGIGGIIYQYLWNQKMARDAADYAQLQIGLAQAQALAANASRS